MSTKQLVQETYTETVDKQTGEIDQQSKTQVFTFPKEPPYIKLYLEDIEKIYSLPNNSSGVIYELLKRLDYEGLIALNSTTKKMICDRTGYKLQSLNNYLGSLVKKGIFKKAGRGVFQPDPNLFGRGDWKSIYKMREAWIKINYREDGTKDVSSSLGEDE